MKKTALIILAAGPSSRLGQPKQLVKIDGQTLLEKAASTALLTDCQPIVVVLGAHSEKIKSVVSHLPVEVVINENWETGMGSSIACGVRHLEEKYPGTDAALILLCDQPLLQASHLKKLMEVYLATASQIVASEYGGALGPPAIFDRAVFPQLMGLSGKSGAKKIIEANRATLAAVSFPEGKTDVDTPEDLQKLEGFETKK